jgi:hypothetical protein
MATYASAGTYGTYLPPNAPTGLTGSAASPTQINLSWTASTDTSGVVAGYTIYRNGAQIATTTSTSYSDTGVAASTTYTYTVAAYDTVNIPSAQSGGINVTTPAGVVQITDSNGHQLTSLYRSAVVPAVCGNGSGNGPCNFTVIKTYGTQTSVRVDTGPTTNGPWTNQSLSPGYTIGTGSNALSTYASSAVYGK